jgi:serpin B
MKKFISFSFLFILIFTIDIVYSKSISESSTDERCGKGVGSCKNGECCSKYGWCGKTDKHCKVEEGCQSEFGKCSSKTNDTNGKCGKGIGSCKNGECCSKYGWCGKTDKYCNIEKGCQSEFGKCNPTVTETTTKTSDETSVGKCGKGIGSCKNGECCSKYGWCGKTDKYCNIEKGCQSEFGKCNPTVTETTTKTPEETPVGKCGKGYSSCKNGECCSKYGWCGKTDAYCEINRGCQPEFGYCNEKIENTNPVNNSTVISNTHFDFSFLKMENDKNNMLYSPLSIKYALYMLKDGANSNTFDEINKVVGNTELPKYKSIDKNLSLANGLFIRDTYYENVEKLYINTLKEKYDAEVVKDEFKDAQNVNQWIEDKTLGIIKNMLKDEVVQEPLNVMLIVNALAIDMKWESSFDFEKTQGETFYLDDGQEMKATTMIKRKIKSKIYSFYKDDDITVLTMDLKDYDKTQFEFMAIMPKENLSTFIENVSEEQVNQIDKKLKLSSNEKDGINIKIPKFKFNYNLKLKKDLIDLGIKDAFNSKNADFSKISKLNDISVSDALHKADIEFTEEGVKAAAVTVFHMTLSTGPDEKSFPVDIIINKPFMFIIRDKNTKAIWFTGTVYKPNSWIEDKKLYI